MNNPLFDWITRNYNISTQATLNMLWKALGTGAFLTWSEFAFFGINVTSLFHSIAIIGLWSLLFLAPIVISIVTSELVSYELNKSLYHSIIITPITNMQLIYAFFKAALFRTRSILIFVGIAVMPTLVVSMTRGYLLSRMDCTGNSDFFQLCSNVDWPTAVEWLTVSIIFAGTVIGIMGINILSITLGIAFGLRWHSAVKAIITSIITIPAMLSLSIGVILNAWSFQLGELPLILKGSISFSFIVSLIALSFSPYIVAILILFITQSWARSITNSVSG